MVKEQRTMKFIHFSQILWNNWNDSNTGYWAELNAFCEDIIISYMKQVGKTFIKGITLEFFMQMLDGQFMIYHQTADGETKNYVELVFDVLTE